MNQHHQSSSMNSIAVICLAFMLISSTTAADYNYKSSGTDWTGTCATGSLQSPIDISDVQGSCDNTMNLTFQWTNESLSTNIIKDNQDLRSVAPTGKYWSYLYASDINGVINGYRSSYFSFHSPAENYLDGSQSDVEMQIVHDINTDFQASSSASSSSTQAIVSVMFNVDDSATTTFFSSYDTSTAGLAADSPTAMSLNMSTLMSSFLTLTGEYYSFQGSKTSPTCDENVNWYVYSQKLSITSTQLSQIQAFFAKELTFAQGKGNNRALQATNSRTVKKGNIQCEEQFIHFFSFFVIYTFLNFFVCKML